MGRTSSHSLCLVVGGVVGEPGDGGGLAGGDRGPEGDGVLGEGIGGVGVDHEPCAGLDLIVETLAGLKAQQLETSRALEESGIALHAAVEALSPVGELGTELLAALKATVAAAGTVTGSQQTRSELTRSPRRLKSSCASSMISTRLDPLFSGYSSVSQDCP